MRLSDARSEAHRQARAVAWTMPSLATPCSRAIENALQRGELRRLNISLRHGRSGPVLPTGADLEAAPIEDIVAIVLDALTSLPRAQLGCCIGRFSNDDQKRLNHGLLVVSGLAR